MQRPVIPQWRRIATPFALAFVSLIAAVVLWVAVSDAENPNQVRTISAAIEVRPVNVPDGLAIERIDPAVVSVTVSTTEETFKRLTASDFRAEINLASERRPSSEQTIEVSVVGNLDRDVKIVSSSPAIATVTLETSSSKQVPVRVVPIGAPPQGYTLAEGQASPSNVTVTGAASLIRLVEYAAAEVNVTGLRATIQQQTQLIPRDAQGLDISGIQIEPSTADVRLAITQQEVVLSLPIVPAVQGTVADGYNLVGISSDPPALAVTGPLEVLQAVSFLTTDSVDASGLKAEVTRTVRLRIPAGLQASRDSVVVRLRVVPAQGEVILAVAPQVTSVGDNLQASLQTTSVDILLRGELPTLRSLTSESVKATINASGLAEGVHVLQPQVSAPEGVEVVSINPTQIVVVLRR